MNTRDPDVRWMAFFSVLAIWQASISSTLPATLAATLGLFAVAYLAIRITTKEHHHDRPRYPARRRHRRR